MGRLTSEMVLKVTYMGIPILVSRTGVTQHGTQTGQENQSDANLQGWGQHFLVYHGFDTLQLDAKPGESLGIG